MALFFSILLHFTVLVFLNPARPVNVLKSDIVLTVSLAPAPNSAIIEPASAEKPLSEPIEEQPEITKEKPEIEQMTIEKPISSSPQKTTTNPANNHVIDIQNSLSGKEVKSTPSDPTIRSQESDSASQVQALLLIDADGKVQQIIWNKLPAITEEGLSKMEQRLRQKNYLITGKSYTTTETVEVVRDN
ncbi:MAG TPA: hypothetical protein VIE65_10570 [Methylobacter sp.]